MRVFVSTPLSFSLLMKKQPHSHTQFSLSFDGCPVVPTLLENILFCAAKGGYFFCPTQFFIQCVFFSRAPSEPGERIRPPHLYGPILTPLGFPSCCCQIKFTSLPTHPPSLLSALPRRPCYFFLRPKLNSSYTAKPKCWTTHFFGFFFPSLEIISPCNFFSAPPPSMRFSFSDPSTPSKLIGLVFLAFLFA